MIQLRRYYYYNMNNTDCHPQQTERKTRSAMIVIYSDMCGVKNRHTVER